ncbi:MAG: bifunctional 2-polyprenyl-6-hydroxyphenol methylase/3-demethylubiquinol 3-O-methyltransferase UbiG [Proteobacteria bacterium]|nr:bifunctional 2-polyprenyl-6-hydroxyphenol methylase/3-demethylubiquinol 3-O-methyltransferase UbiG [Pseudomonadota bacterium]
MDNVDAGEVKKFAAMAARWWDPEGDFKPLHRLNPLRMDYIAQRCELRGAVIADIGCGGGLLSEAMAAAGAEVTGVDAADAPLQVARLHLLESGLQVDYLLATAEKLLETHAEKFDVVTCLEMLEHVPDPSAVVSACAGLVKPGGQVIFSTINRNPKAYALAVIGAEYVLGMLPKGTHDYRKFIRPSELAAWCRDAGLAVHDITGMTYNPLTDRFRLKRDTDVNYLMHCSREQAP